MGKAAGNKQIRYNGRLSIATGSSRMEKTWKNKTVSWGELLERLKKPAVTPESYQEYMSLPKSEQDRIKDVGGFIGGVLEGGSRKADAVESRQLVALDADFAPQEILEDIGMGMLPMDYAYAVYSTHKHSADKPRLRFLIPLDRPVSPDEYEAVGRKIADSMNIEYFDDTTYQAGRLMYWPSVSKDGEYLFTYEDMPWLSADRILAEYPDWTDTSFWPESSHAGKTRKRSARKQGDPCEKKGLIGAFCRTYPIEEAIEKFLPDIYEPCAVPGRYTYTAGSTAAGLVIYEDKFAYSNHATDPAGGKLCNAFDLVRIHKFGHLDEGAEESTQSRNLPSFKEMQRLCSEDGGTKVTLVSEKQKEAQSEFKDTVEEKKDWIADLEVNEHGVIKNTLNNLNIILEKDECLRGIRFNQLAERIDVTSKLPWENPGYWRDADDAHLESYLAETYREFTKTKVISALVKAADDRAYHPVREYLQTLPKWDGKKRVDKLLVDYLNAEDSPYTRAVTRKTLCAAVKRVQNPGCKFDYMLVLNGPQGVGKSTLAKKLGRNWFSDSLSLADTKDKTAAEKLQGNWILEIAELAGMRKTEIETLKGFISRQDDKYRASYGRVVQPHPRQCIMIGTTNAQEDGFIRDNTGGRRFWPVNVDQGKTHPRTLTETDVSQIWAEVMVYVEAGETLYLDAELEKHANLVQQMAGEKDDREGLVREYLDRKLPDHWDAMSIYERREYLHGDEFGQQVPEGTEVRLEVSNIEIWCECLCKNKADFNRKMSFEISAIMKGIEGWTEIQEKSKRIPLYGPQKVRKRK